MLLRIFNTILIKCIKPINLLQVNRKFPWFLAVKLKECLSPKEAISQEMLHPSEQIILHKHYKAFTTIKTAENLEIRKSPIGENQVANSEDIYNILILI